MMGERSAAMQAVPGFWPGTVVDTEDPDKAGRIRVRVDQVYGAPDEAEKIEDADLPWARASFPMTGDKSGEFWVPPVGATVWVVFWGGSRQKPVWLGGWFTPDTVPDAASSSYDAEPKTRIVRTDNGHEFEMRWKDKEKQIRHRTEGGIKSTLADSDELGGPKVEFETPGGFKVSIDQKTKKITIVTPGSRSVTLDDDGQKLTIATTKHTITLDDASSKMTVDAQNDIEVTAAGTLKTASQGDTEVTSGAKLKTAATGDAEHTSGGKTSIAATGDLEESGVNVTLTASAIAKLIGSTVSLGSGGAATKLMDDRLITILNTWVAIFNGHTHVGTLITSPPLAAQVPLAPGAANTNITKGD